MMIHLFMFAFPYLSRFLYELEKDGITLESFLQRMNVTQLDELYWIWVSFLIFFRFLHNDPAFIVWCNTSIIFSIWFSCISQALPNHTQTYLGVSNFFYTSSKKIFLLVCFWHLTQWKVDIMLLELGSFRIFSRFINDKWQSIWRSRFSAS